MPRFKVTIVKKTVYKVTARNQATAAFLTKKAASKAPEAHIDLARLRLESDQIISTAVDTE
jgi:hypothetical protein